MNKRYILVLIFLAMIVKADFSEMDWQYKKQIGVSDIEGIGRVKIDVEVYNNSKYDLSDLRVIDDDGKEVPYKLETLKSEKEAVCFEPKMYNLSNVPYEYTEFYLDVGEENKTINRLQIVTPDKNFRKKVEIWGSDDGIKWLNIRDDANIFGFYTEDYRTSLTDIEFPNTIRRYFKIVIWNKEENPLKIDGCRVYDEKIVEVSLEDIPFKILSREENREKKRTEVVLDVVYKNIPEKEIKLKFASGGYHRNVWIYGSDDAEDWKLLSSGVIYMYNKENKNNVISLPESGNRYFKLLIYNQDDPPLKIDDMSIKYNRRFMCFPVKKNKKYYLFYGNSYARSPLYEFERLLSFMETEENVLLDLGEEQLNEKLSRIKEVIKEDETFLIWPMIAFVIIALGYLIFKSLKGINEKRRKKEKRKEWKERYEKQKSQERKFR
jgi:hypothetical protein